MPMIAQMRMKTWRSTFIMSFEALLRIRPTGVLS